MCNVRWIVYFDDMQIHVVFFLIIWNIISIIQFVTSQQGIIILHIIDMIIRDITWEKHEARVWPATYYLVDDFSSMKNVCMEHVHKRPFAYL